MDVTYRPIGNDWPGKRTSPMARKSSPFRVPYANGGGRTPWSRTLEDLDRELYHLEARRVIFQIDLKERDIRVDGMPRGDARVNDSAVIISFESAHGPLRYFCDSFDHWQDNVRAIALGLESLRRVERYGITHRGEQYAGFKQLPPGSGANQNVVLAFAGVRDAAAYMLKLAGVDGNRANMDEVVITDKAYRDELFKRAAMKVHPDKGGNRADWDTLVEARRIIETEASK